MTLYIRRLITVTCVATLLSPSTAWAGIQPTPFRTGLFSIARGQGVRISIVNAGNARSIINPCVMVWSIEGRVLGMTDFGPIRGGRG